MRRRKPGGASQHDRRSFLSRSSSMQHLSSSRRTTSRPTEADDTSTKHTRREDPGDAYQHSRRFRELDEETSRRYLPDG